MVSNIPCIFTFPRGIDTKRRLLIILQHLNCPQRVILGVFARPNLGHWPSFRVGRTDTFKVDSERNATRYAHASENVLISILVSTIWQQCHHSVNTYEFKRWSEKILNRLVVNWPFLLPCLRVSEPIWPIANLCFRPFCLDILNC